MELDTGAAISVIPDYHESNIPHLVRLDWKMTKKVTQHPDSKKHLKGLLEKNKEVFEDELGHIKEFIKQGSKYKKCKAKNFM